METTRPSLLARLGDPRDERAWREFDGRYRELVLRYAQRRGLQRWDAEDVLQTVLLALSKAMGRFKYDPAVGRFRSYLGRVVDNAVRRQGSRPAGEPVLLDEEVLGVLAPIHRGDRSAVDDHWEEEWRLHHLRLAMQQIRENTKERDVAIFDRLLAGESVREVASATGLTEEAVHKVKQRIRDRLRAYVTAQIRDEDGLTP